MSDPQTLAWYDSKARDYVAAWPLEQSRDLEEFLERLSANAFILELGCGGGHDSAHMIKQGFKVDPTDGSAGMVDQSNQRYSLGARQMRFDELNANAKYDAVWANACLLHLPRADLPAALTAIHTALKLGGMHYANYKLSDPDHPDEGRDPLGRWANLPSSDWLEQQYREAGFEIVESRRYRGNGSDGILRDWQALTVRKPA